MSVIWLFQMSEILMQLAQKIAIALCTMHCGLRLKSLYSALKIIGLDD
ncbi:hypothetical protein [Thalassotalea agariperforans]